MKSSNEVTLWTIQKEDAWEQAKKTGILKPDGRRVHRYFQEPYRWLIDQMEQRIQDYPGGYPVWAWPEKPDLRRSGHLNPGQKGVRLEFIADPNNILVSDFDAWHDVLNGTQLYAEDQHENRDYFNVWTQGSDNPARTAEVINSWEKIFDIELLKELNAPQRLQATIGAIAVEQIVYISEFTAR